MLGGRCCRDERNKSGGRARMETGQHQARRIRAITSGGRVICKASIASWSTGVQREA